MNRLMRMLVLSVALTGIAASGSAFAQTKIGFVNTVKLMEQAPQAKAASSKVESEFAPREKELVALQKKIKGLEDKLNRNGAVMSQSEQQKLERELRSKQREFKRNQDEFRQDLNIRRNEELSKLQRQLYHAIVSLAKKENFDLVVSDSVIYASDRIDITDQVLSKLKADYKAGSANNKK